MTRLILCAKSSWDPAFRREHELARLAARAGHEVSFVERPRDIRELANSRRREWLDGLAGAAPRTVGDVAVIGRSTFVPGHRHAVAGRLDQRLLASLLDRLGGAVIVATVPWDWPAVARCKGARRIFDCTDDWCEIMPARSGRLRALYDRIAREADAIICASEYFVLSAR
ncbi:MAG TPA: hypothetical protein VFD90_18545 [Gaiellales bacterium]|jgi:hypothetical protein|nr:hypothetical protein [Gaiellales bacterium]